MLEPRVALTALLVTAALVTSGCVTKVVRKQLEQLKPEPNQVVLRNSTYMPLESMRVEEDADEASSSRLGSVAPLLNGQSFVFARSKNAARLPARARVTWVDGLGPRVSRMSIKEIIAQSNGNDALVFDLQPPGVVRAYLETNSR